MSDQDELVENNKELDLLYEIARLSNDYDASLHDLFQRVVERVPPAWQYPEITCARIIYESEEFRTADFSKTEWSQTAHIEVEGEEVGTIEVYYRKEKSEAEEGPFLQKERKLINSAARLLGRIISDRETRLRKERLNSVLRSVRNVNQLLVTAEEKDELMEGVCEILAETGGCQHAWIARLNDSRELVLSAQAGLEEDFEEAFKQIRSGRSSDPLRKALDQPGVVVVEDPAKECEYSFLAEAYQDQSLLAARLERDGRPSGILSTAVPARFAEDKEVQNLFAEVVEDTSFGLHNLETQNDLREREDQLKRSQEIAKVGSWKADMETGEFNCSEQTCRIFGFSRDELIDYEDFLALTHPEDRDLIQEGRERLLKGEIYEIEHRIIVDGETKWVKGKTEIIFDQQGEPQQIIGTVQDITERKEAEAELEKSESKFRAISERVHDGLFIQSGGKFEWLNERVSEILGYSKEELYQKNVWDLLHPEDRNKVKAIAKKRVAGRNAPSTYEARVLTKGGEVKHGEFAVTLIEYKGEHAILGAVRDITERKKAERKVEQRAKQEHLLRQQSARFLNCQGSELDIAIEDGLAEIGELLEVDRTYIFQFDWKREETSNTHEWCGEGIESQKDNLQNVPTSSIPAWMEKLKDLEIIHIPSVPDLPESWEAEREILEAQDIQSLVVVPISYDQNLLGFAGFDAVREKRKWDSEEIDLLKVFGDLTGSALHFREMEEELRENEDQLRGSFIELAETTSRVLGVRDPYTQQHEQRVAELAREVGKKMRLDEGKLLGLYIGGVLHDIGKIAVPETILTKPGELKDVEWEMIKSHPKVGYNQILEDTDFPWPVAEMTLHHHERLDGSGYPDGLEGDELTEEVRILGAVDVVEAMSTRRPYREARTKERTLNVIKDGKGTKFDPEVVDILVEMIEGGKIGFGGE
jgi:PAS domain S-box-containing protein